MAQARAASLKFLGVFWNREEGNKWSGQRLEAIYAQVSARAEPFRLTRRASARVRTAQAPSKRLTVVSDLYITYWL